MHPTIRPLARGLAALGLVVAFSDPAQAGIESCGNIDVEAQAECEAVGGVECTGRCAPVAFEAACKGSLETTCTTECTDLPTVDCEATCTGECQAECEVEPAQFSCTGSCGATCEGNCTTECEAADDRAACEASCTGRCEGECSASCEGQPAEATCEGKCGGSCQGSCTVDTSFACEIRCQTEGQAECQADLQGGCEVDCQSSEGAIFCDGEYVDHGGNFEDCKSALNAVLAVEVNITATADATGTCEGNACEGEATASCQCAAPGRAPSSPSIAGVLLALGLVGAASRRGRYRRA